MAKFFQAKNEETQKDPKQKAEKGFWPPRATGKMDQNGQKIQSSGVWSTRANKVCFLTCFEEDPCTRETMRVSSHYRGLFKAFHWTLCQVRNYWTQVWMISPWNAKDVIAQQAVLLLRSTLIRLHAEQGLCSLCLDLHIWSSPASLPSATNKST